MRSSLHCDLSGLPRRLLVRAVALAFFLGAVSTAMAQGLHPSFTITTLRPSGFDPMVSGLDFLPDGRLVVATWEGFGNTKGSVYIVSNAQTGDASKITYKKFASNLNEPLGVKVVDGEIYLLQKDQLSYLPDKNNDGLADEVKKVASGWTVQPGVAKSLEFAMGMVYRDSVFYGALATNWPLDAKQSDERGCIIQLQPKTGGFKNFACGTRTANGMVLGPNDDLFVTENQGNWVPSSKLLHIQQGRFYGVHKPVPGPFDNVPETPPAIWLDHGNIGITPSQPAYLKSGIYAGQMIAGDENLGTLQRYFLEKVGGEYQGCVFRFSGGLDAGANRLIVGPDGAMYVGGIGTPDWGGWSWNNKFYGLQRMMYNGKKTFEMLAVRSMGPTSLELEFTTPVGTGADKAASYQVKQWFYKPEVTYGVGKQTVENLTVNSVKVSSDKLKVTLEIAGMKVKNVVYLKLTGVNSAENAASWTTEAWYTQNAFGPGVAVAVATKQAAAGESIPPRVQTVAAGGGRISMKVEGAGGFRLDIRDSQGRILESRTGTGPMEMLSEAEYGHGVYLLSLKTAAGVFHQRIMNP